MHVVPMHDQAAVAEAVGDTATAAATPPSLSHVLLAAPDGKLTTASDGSVAGAVVEISQPADQNAALALVGSVEWMMLDSVSQSDSMFIPVENLVAAVANTGTRLAVKTRTVEEVQGVALALQTGVDALVVDADAAADVVAAAEAAVAEAVARRATAKKDKAAAEEEGGVGSSGSSSSSKLKPCRVVSTSPGGMGDRVCLDLTVMLSDAEGCLLGSSAKALALVHGETAASGFVPSRPFRVNAGPVHQYVMMADGSTKYLAEVRAGDEVALFSSDTGARSEKRPSATVGRCKIEPRPMLLVEFETGAEGGEATATVFLQQAETVRLATTKKGRGGEGRGGGEVGAGEDETRERTPVTVLKPGADFLRVAMEKRGTHVGKRIEADVRER